MEKSKEITVKISDLDTDYFKKEIWPKFINHEYSYLIFPECQKRLIYDPFTKNDIVVYLIDEKIFKMQIITSLNNIDQWCNG